MSGRDIGAFVCSIPWLHWTLSLYFLYLFNQVEISSYEWDAGDQSKLLPLPCTAVRPDHLVLFNNRYKPHTQFYFYDRHTHTQFNFYDRRTHAHAHIHTHTGDNIGIHKSNSHKKAPLYESEKQWSTMSSPRANALKTSLLHSHMSGWVTSLRMDTEWMTQNFLSFFAGQILTVQEKRLKHRLQVASFSSPN